MVALFSLHGSRTKVAASIGVHETVLRAYLSRAKRSALRETCYAIQPKRPASAYRPAGSYTTNYPSDDAMVALMAVHRTYGAVAEALGLSRGSIRDYLRIRPALAEKMRVHQRPKLTPEQIRENSRRACRAYMRRKQLEDPETLRASKRKSERKRREGKTASFGAVEYAQVLALDPCTYCGGPSAEIDHIVSLARGGNGDYDNLTPACRNCNRRKYTRSALYFMLERAAA